MVEKSELRERWERISNPKKLADYGLTINLSELEEKEPEIFKSEVALFLPLKSTKTK